MKDAVDAARQDLAADSFELIEKSFAKPAERLVSRSKPCSD